MTATTLRCIRCARTYALGELRYNCDCGGLLEVAHDPALLRSRSANEWRALFASRRYGAPGPDGSGVWRYREWVLPELPLSDIVTLGEGGTPLVQAQRLSEELGLELYVKQCGQSLSGSFKDLGMTVLVSQVVHMKKRGSKVSAVACASTGDTSAALAAYGAAAGLRTLVLLPRGKVSAAQLVQPLAHGARVLAIDTDFDGCMKHVQRLAEEDGVYLANSKNSLRIEGQKTVAFEIAEQLGYELPEWVAIPGGNLGNVSALYAGFRMLKEAGLTTHVPRLICAQAAAAAPLYASYEGGFAKLEPVVAGETQASAIRIGNPVSYEKAVTAVTASQGVVVAVSEHELTRAARRADETGLYVCPHTAVALAGVFALEARGTIAKNERVVVVATAHGLKFTEFKVATAADSVPGVKLGASRTVVEVPDRYDAVRAAAFQGGA